MKQGCPICNESTGEKEISNILKQKNIDYNREYRFDDCKNKNTLPFDFYLPELNICIEFDGIQHFESIDFFGGDVSLKETQKRDQIKNEYCEENNIKLIRIKYNENIKNKLKKFFS